MSTTKTKKAIEPNACYGLVRGTRYERKKKAYHIDLNKIDEGYLFCDESCFAENINKAKSILLKRADDAGMQLNSLIDSEITYLNIPVVRKKSSDVFLFESEEKTLAEIEMILIERNRQKDLNDILANPEIKYCYIKKGIYYRPNYAGYTDYKKQAGVYPKKDAVSHARGVCEITIVPVDIIEHNAMINSEIANLKTRLL